MKNIKPMQSNLFVHGIGLKIRAWSDMEGIEVIGYDWSQNSMKKYLKRSLKIKSWKSWMPRFLVVFFDLNHSYIYTYANPIQNKLPAAQKRPRTNLNFLKKTQIWKPISRSIQATTLIPSCSWGFKERIQIKIIHPNIKNW